jgi:hypothetical protein
VPLGRHGRRRGDRFPWGHPSALPSVPRPPEGLSRSESRTQW